MRDQIVVCVFFNFVIDLESFEAYTDSIFDLVCYVFGKLFVEFWVVKLPETLSFVFLCVHYYSGLTFIRGLNDYVVSFSKIFESFSFLLGQVICNFQRFGV